MFARRASADLFWIVTSGRLRTCFSLGFVVLFLFSWALGPAVAITSGHNRANRTIATGAVSPTQATSDQGANSQQVLTSPAGEASELYPPTTLRFDSHESTVSLWQSKELTSSRIVPRGLVLSFLCDSARHRCSGVLLA